MFLFLEIQTVDSNNTAILDNVNATTEASAPEPIVNVTPATEPETTEPAKDSGKKGRKGKSKDKPTEPAKAPEPVKEEPTGPTPAEERKRLLDSFANAYINSERAASHGKILSGKFLQLYVARCIKDGQPRAGAIKCAENRIYSDIGEAIDSSLCLKAYWILQLAIGDEAIDAIENGTARAFPFSGLKEIQTAVERKDSGTNPNSNEWEFSKEVKDVGVFRKIVKEFFDGVDEPLRDAKRLKSEYDKMRDFKPAPKKSKDGATTTNPPQGGITVAGQQTATTTTTTEPAKDATTGAPAPLSNVTPETVEPARRKPTATEQAEALHVQLRECAEPSMVAQHFGFQLQGANLWKCVVGMLDGMAIDAVEKLIEMANGALAKKKAKNGASANGHPTMGRISA